MLSKKQTEKLKKLVLLAHYLLISLGIYIHGFLTRRLGYEIDLFFLHVELDFAFIFYALSLTGFSYLATISTKSIQAKIINFLSFLSVYIFAFADLFYFRFTGSYIDLELALANSGFAHEGMGIFFADRWLIIYFGLMTLNLLTHFGLLTYLKADTSTRVVASILFAIIVSISCVNVWNYRNSSYDLAFMFRPVLAIVDIYKSEEGSSKTTDLEELRGDLGYAKLSGDVDDSEFRQLDLGTPVFMIVLESINYAYIDDRMAGFVPMPFLKSLVENYAVFDRAVSGSAHTMNGLVSLVCGQITRSEKLNRKSMCLPNMLRKFGYKSSMWYAFNNMESKHRLLFEEMGFTNISDSRSLTEQRGEPSLQFMYDETLYRYALTEIQEKESLDHNFFLIGTNQTHFPGFSDHPSCNRKNIGEVSVSSKYHSFIKSAACADSALEALVEEIEQMVNEYVLVVVTDHPIDVGLGDGLGSTDVGLVPLVIKVNRSPIEERFPDREDYFSLGATYDMPSLVMNLLGVSEIPTGLGVGPLSKIRRQFVVSTSSTCRIGILSAEEEKYAECIPFARNLGVNFEGSASGKISDELVLKIFKQLD